VVGMIVIWLDNSKVDLTDELIRESFENYVLQSHIAEGPTFNISKYPNWIEDLPEDNSENHERILTHLKSEWKKFLKTPLKEFEEITDKVKSQRIHGRDVTVDGKQYTSTKLFDTDGNKVSDIKHGSTRNAAIRAWKKVKAEELDKQVTEEEISEYQPIAEWEYDRKTNRIKFWYLLPFDSTGNKEMFIESFTNPQLMADWIGFDWDNQEAVDKLITATEEISNYFQGKTKLPLDSFDEMLEITEMTKSDRAFQFKFNFLGSKTQLEKHMKDIGAGKYGELTNMKMAAKTTKGEKDTLKRILPEPIARPKQQPSKPLNYPFSVEKDAKVLTTKAVTKKWVKNNVRSSIEEMLLNPRFHALNPLEIQTITVTGNAFYEPDIFNIKVNYTIEITIEDKYDVKETESLPAKAPPTESKVGGGAVIGGKKAGSISIQSQFRTLIYNPVRREWGNHVAARIRRLDEKLGD
jgi:hypothetical protein